MNMEPISITVAAARQALGIGTTKIYELIGSGKLETIKVGRRRLILMASIKRFTASATISQPTADGAKP
jgi:excisionase family DNA binding protein